MDTTTKEKFSLDASKEQEIQNPYAKKYMKDKYRIVIKDDVTEKVRKVKGKRGFTSDNETIRYLCDLEEKVDPTLRIVHRCKTCNEEIINIPEDINVNKFVHNDLCKTASCKGHIHTKSEIALNDKGFVISNKDKTNGTNESNDKNRVQTEQKTKTPEEIEEEEWFKKYNPNNYKIDPNAKKIAFSEIGKELAEE